MTISNLELKKIHTCEGLLIMRMLSLSKTMRHTKLMDALKYERETTIITNRKRKLNFYKKLNENEVTNDILKHRWEFLKES